jgi:hypothetical protein
MRVRIIAGGCCLLLAAGCSGSGSNSASAGAAYNDVATGARLIGVNLSRGMNAPDRAARLAECSAVLTSHVSQVPPPERADRLRALADRLQQAAIALGGANGRTAADINHIRDEAIAAQRQLAANNAGVYASSMAQAVDHCGVAEIMTDDELAGRGSTLSGNTLAPTSVN